MFGRNSFKVLQSVQLKYIHLTIQVISKYHSPRCFKGPEQVDEVRRGGEKQQYTSPVLYYQPEQSVLYYYSSTLLVTTIVITKLNLVPLQVGTLYMIHRIGVPIFEI